jgi:hypothetical protein
MNWAEAVFYSIAAICIAASSIAMMIVTREPK